MFGDTGRSYQFPGRRALKQRTYVQAVRLSQGTIDGVGTGVETAGSHLVDITVAEGGENAAIRLVIELDFKGIDQYVIYGAVQIELGVGTIHVGGANEETVLQQGKFGAKFQ